MNPGDPIISSFVRHLEANGAKATTLRSYRVDAQQLVEFLAAQHGGRAAILRPKAHTELLKAVTADQVQAYLAHLATKYSKATVYRKHSALRAFVNWLADECHVRQNPMVEIEPEKFERPVPKYITLEEVERLITTPDATTWNGARDRAIYETIYSGGLRMGEVTELTRGDVDFAEGTMMVKGVHDQKRSVAMAPAAARAIRRYLKLLGGLRQFSGKFGPRAPLWINKNGGKLSSRGIRRNLDGYLKQAGLDPRISPHTLCHSFARHLTDEGLKPGQLRDVMGRTSTLNTRQYKRAERLGGG